MVNCICGFKRHFIKRFGSYLAHMFQSTAPLHHAKINGNKLFHNLIHIDTTRYRKMCIIIMVQTRSVLNWFLHQKQNCMEMTNIFRKYMRQNADDELAVRHCFSVQLGRAISNLCMPEITAISEHHPVLYTTLVHLY